MAEDLDKYESLASAVENIDFDGALFQKCATAITELVAMVREDRADADGMAQMMVAVQERAEAAERDAQAAAANTLHVLHQLSELKKERDKWAEQNRFVADECQKLVDKYADQRDAAERERDEARDLTWFWQIVDRNGLSDVCSDERGALAELTRAHRELAELKRKMRDPDGMMLVAMADAALYDSENKIPEVMMKDALLAAVNHLLGEKK